MKKMKFELYIWYVNNINNYEIQKYEGQNCSTD